MGDSLGCDLATDSESGIKPEDLLSDAEKEAIFKASPMDGRCPRQCKTLPGQPCRWALNAVYLNLVKTDPQKLHIDESEVCDWWVWNEDANYCFFAYQRLYGGVGHTLDEISGITLSNIATVNSLERKALAKTKKKFVATK